MNPKIISLGYAVPYRSYSQKDIFENLGYPKHFWRIFRDAKIDTRHFCVPLERINGLSFQEQQVEYLNQAIPLALEAVRQCLDKRDTKNIGLITWSTCTGFPPGPTPLHYLVKELSLNSDVQLNNLSSQGCEAAFPGLRRCHDFTALNRQPSLTIACELTSLTYYPEEEGKPDPENDYELLRANAIFADGCSCALVGYDDDPRHPEIVDFTSHLDTTYMADLGYVWRNGRLRVRLSRGVPFIATSLLDKAIFRLLLRNQLTINDITYWVIHPPGAAVLDQIRDNLGISDDQLKYSREALKLYGNTSSSSVGIVGKLLIENLREPDGYLVMVNVGPGMVANATLMRFGHKAH